ncbi:MAG: DUF362 domain-containing protein [Candidatus Heimdallarchaeota archaeon]|nr:MAG: DUF362 domain-containing protein [Candidatus Heimdallarchaeota archaeon]
MASSVAVVDHDSLLHAFDLVDGIHYLTQSEKEVVIKVGIYNPDTGICTTVDTLNSIINAFDKSPKIRVTESDSGAGPGLQRLEIWRDCYSDRVVPFNLSDDKDTNIIEVAGERVPLSHILFEPNVFISTHVPRRYEDTGDEDLMNMGSIIKNLLGLIPDKKKYRFHEQLPNALLDMYEAIGGIDLAILDGTHVFLGWKNKRLTVSPQVLIIGKDAFAVEAIGAHLVGFDPTKMPVLQEARNRGLGEIDIDKIEVIGDIETPKHMIIKAFRNLSSEKGREEQG